MKKYLSLIIGLLLLLPGVGWSANLNYTAAQLNSKLSGVPTTNVISISCTGTEATDKAAIDAALASLYTLGGGTMVIVGVCRYDSQLVLANDGTSSPLYKQPPLRITGVGGPDANGLWSATTATPPSAIDLRYATGAIGKIVTTGLGYLEIDHITLMDKGSANTTPFLRTTNTTVNVHDVALKGSTATADTSNDGFIFGGNDGGAVPGNLTSSWFQGYGSRVKNVWFDQIRKVAQFNSAANHIDFSNNVISSTCSNTAGAAIIFTGFAGNLSSGNFVTNNLFEWGQYAYIFQLDYANKNQFIGNGYWDASAGSTTVFYFPTDTGSYSNTIISGLNVGTKPLFSGHAGTIQTQIVTDPYTSIKQLYNDTVPSMFGCNDTNRSQHFFFAGPAGAPDYEFVCMKDADDAYTWKMPYYGTLGADLITNGTFGSDANWSKESGWYISGGKGEHAVNADCAGAGNPAACCSGAGAGTCGAGSLYQAVGAQYKAYQITMTVSGRTAGTLTIELAGWRNTVLSADGTYTFLIYARTNDTNLYLSASATFDGAVDDISMKELLLYKY